MFDQLTNWTQCTCCYQDFEHRGLYSINAIFYFFFGGGGGGANFSHMDSVDGKEGYEVTGKVIPMW